MASLVLILGERVVATQPWGRAALFLLSGTAMVIALSRAEAARRADRGATSDDTQDGFSASWTGVADGARLRVDIPKASARLRSLLNFGAPRS